MIRPRIRLSCHGPFTFVMIGLSGLVSLFSINAKAQSTRKVWIEFQDKGPRMNLFRPGNSFFDSVFNAISPLALERRRRALNTERPSEIVTAEDAPICREYVDSLVRLGMHPINQSCWTNSVSAFVDDKELASVSKLSFVKRISPVGQSSGWEPANAASTKSALKAEGGLSLGSAMDIPPDSIRQWYGYSESALWRIDVPPLHALGFDATGVHLGFLDTGFRWKAIDALNSRHVEHEYDFVFKDSITGNQEADQPGQDGHGTGVMSAAVGYLPDSLVGPAYNATIMLAKTEDGRSETPREEDNYTAALEWMENNGIQITTSSLGYFNFDSGFVSYTYQDMNGHHSISSRAVERAAKLGVLVLNAMGNSGSGPYPYMLTPADADSIIAVGALDVDDTIAGFSSRGPTADGRIKPEICTPGVSVELAGVDGSFYPGTGTSFATPLAAGSCALIEQAHPEAGAQAVRAAIMNTGIRLHEPDTAYGWGRLDAYQAALALGTVIGPPRVAIAGGQAILRVGMAANNGIDSGIVIWGTDDTGALWNRTPLVRDADSNRYYALFPYLPDRTRVRYVIEAIDRADTATYLPRDPTLKVFSFIVNGIASATTVVSHQLQISLNPNPATNHSTINFEFNPGGTLHVYDASGREIVQETIRPGTNSVVLPLAQFAAGAYYIRFFTSTAGRTATAQAALTIIR